jgi:hypothetical protein
MQPELPAPSGEANSPASVRISDLPLPPNPTQQTRRRPLRLLHLMALVAALALTFVITPVLLKVIQKPLSGWMKHEVLMYETSLALIVWTPILALVALVGIAPDSAMPAVRTGSRRSARRLLPFL